MEKKDFEKVFAMLKSAIDLRESISFLSRNETYKELFYDEFFEADKSLDNVVKALQKILGYTIADVVYSDEKVSTIVIE